MPHILDRKSLYPKFRRRVTEAGRARSFGVQTVINDKDKDSWNRLSSTVNPQQLTTSSSIVSNQAKPDELLKEIEALETLMSEVEKKMKVARNETLSKQQIKPPAIDRPLKFRHNVDVQYKKVPSSEHRTSSSVSITKKQSALDLSLVPSESGYLPMASVSRQEFHQQPIHLITDTDMIIAVSKWSEWNEWAECFCEKQVRTRQCIYFGSLSQGCEGDSHESRDCTGGWCPKSTSPSSKTKQTELQRQTFRDLCNRYGQPEFDKLVTFMIFLSNL
ncbi:hypothetical protein DICVIV_01411 [Dictyocaulus viviparus]|uniref:Thrombospondin type 1 domain protein n=1 Tax=Dictyocaulus viviparus TaxID=29172 RepID=A0A0D8Y8X0_DICVI|nr:hypothetical protein DICVIV_01411 [Dictyocaulus viviparus]